MNTLAELRAAGHVVIEPAELRTLAMLMDARLDVGAAPEAVRPLLPTLRPSVKFIPAEELGPATNAKGTT